MEQFRELLFGDQVREVDAGLRRTSRAQRDLREPPSRSSGSSRRLSSRSSKIFRSVARQFDAIVARIEALAGETDAERRSAFEELSRSVLDLGERIRAATTVR